MSEEKISKEEVENISDFARLNLDEDEIDGLVGQLNDILGYFSRIDEVDTEDIEPLHSVNREENKLREDQVEESMSQETALENAEETEKGYFKSPRVRE